MNWSNKQRKLGNLAMLIPFFAREAIEGLSLSLTQEILSSCTFGPIRLTQGEGVELDHRKTVLSSRKPRHFDPFILI